MKVLGRDSLDIPEKPHTCTIRRKSCTIDRKCWFSDNGGYTIAGISDREKKRAEERLRACGVLGPHNEIGNIVEAVSLDDTMGDLRNVLEEGFIEDRTIPVSSKTMDEVIADFGERVELDWTARVDTKYKTMDQKVSSVATTL